MKWDKLTDGYFKGYRFHVAVPNKDHRHGIVSSKIEIERRLQVIEFRDFKGGKINDLEQKVVPITVDIIFHGPSYQAEYEEFKKICSEGTPGILTVPTEEKSFVVYLQKLSVSDAVGESSTKKVSATFLEDTTIDANNLPNQNPPPKEYNVTEERNAILGAIGDVKKSIEESEFLSAVKSFESGLSTVRRYSNAVLAIESGIKARIVDLTTNLQGTLTLALMATSVITDNLLGIDASDDSGKNVGTQIDPETGNEIVLLDDPNEQDDEEEVSEIVEVENPQVKSAVSSIGKDTESSAELALDSIIVDLKKKSDGLSETTGANFEDIRQNLLGIVSSLEVLRSNSAIKPVRALLVPYSISIFEAFLHNEINLSELRRVIRLNFHIDDPLVIPQGEVLYV